MGTERNDHMTFNTYVDRKNTQSVKWDMLQAVFQTDNVLPMWVADMDFKAPKEVNDALIKRATHGIYGYSFIDDHVKGSIIHWIKQQHQWSLQKNWLSFSPGVVPSLRAAIQAFTTKGDKILIQPPVYTPFFDMIKDQQREVVTNPLLLKNNRYEINFTHLEQQLQKDIKAFILCSPHNPVGRVWEENELKEIARLCIKYNVLILSDEIHSDIIYPNYNHIPMASLSDEIANQTITFMSPSKTFNLAGLQASYIITENKDFRFKIEEQLKYQGMMSPNTMGIIALEAAYTHGEEWLHELIETLTNHKNYVIKMFNHYANKLEVIQPEGTYLLWINCHQLNMDDKKLQKFMIEKARVGLNPGISYGAEGNQFMRMNIACPHKTLETGVKRIIQAVDELYA